MEMNFVELNDREIDICTRIHGFVPKLKVKMGWPPPQCEVADLRAWCCNNLQGKHIVFQDDAYFESVAEAMHFLLIWQDDNRL